MKTKYILTFLFTTVLILFIGCEKDLLFQKDIYQSDANPEQVRRADINESIFSMAASSWKHADVSATEADERISDIDVDPVGTAHIVFGSEEYQWIKRKGSWVKESLGFKVYYSNTKDDVMSTPISVTSQTWATAWAPFIDVDKYGNVHIVFQYSNTYYSDGLYFHPGSVAYIYSGDGGETFGDPVTFAINEAVHSPPMVEVDGNDIVHIMYYTYPEIILVGTPNVYHAKKHISDADFTISNLGSFGAALIDDLNIYERNNVIHLLLSKPYDDEGSIYTNNTSGVFFNPPLQVGTQGNLGDIAVGPNDVVHIVYPDGSEFKYAHGNGVDPFTIESTPIQDRNGIGLAVDQSNVVYLLTQYDNEEGLILWKKDGSSWIPETIVLPGSGEIRPYTEGVEIDGDGYAHVTNDRRIEKQVGPPWQTYYDSDIRYHTNDPAFQSGGGDNTIHVEDIDMDIKQKGPHWNAVARVLIFDGDMNPVSGATVTGDWSELVSGTRSSITGADGYATIDSPKTKKTGVTFTFTVTDVSKSGYTYDQNSNKETSDEISN